MHVWAGGYEGRKGHLSQDLRDAWELVVRKEVVMQGPLTLGFPCVCGSLAWLCCPLQTSAFIAMPGFPPGIVVTSLHIVPDFLCLPSQTGSTQSVHASCPGLHSKPLSFPSPPAPSLVDASVPHPQPWEAPHPQRLLLHADVRGVSIPPRSPQPVTEGSWQMKRQQPGPRLGHLWVLPAVPSPREPSCP